MQIRFKFLQLTSLIFGCSLLAINFYGIFQTLRPYNILNSELRFKNDQPEQYEKTLVELSRANHFSGLQLAKKVNNIVSKGVAHIHWEKYPATKFNQLVPIWENYILYLMGEFSKIPEYERYHFSNPAKSIERGVGICGDASMIMSQILDDAKIDNHIISFPGHVVVSTIIDEKEHIFDPDFGVHIPHSASKIHKNPEIIKEYYLSRNYTAYDIKALKNIYKKDYKTWNGVSHFVTNKYYFEKLSYVLKWLLPILLLAVPFIYLIVFSKTLSCRTK